ncbi:hypothetical protein IEU95_14925 [Hoyosella rhizosphaerae]|uniref:Uncharacterized protein n=1 Tax=Hoyosella rhizosphaerae TaxID=1755582 RepID=A0A916UH22_9ACTN|nr:hypothetical protein [Hoyosella rhizosphaerae]MBN4928131.1 hypothetical protein [Hoyosella rhizosphaerae]GGC72614.1 hypothetical protein GCM10011410_27120 [Hoyosella rhizosphaerae]
MNRIRALALIAASTLALATSLTVSGSLINQTDASFNDDVTARGQLTTGDWPTQGYARAIGGETSVTDVLTETADGLQVFRDHNNPGRTNSTNVNIGTGGLLSLFSVSGNASACASYVWGVGGIYPNCFGPTNTDADSRVTVPDYNFSLTLVGVLNVSNMIRVHPSLGPVTTQTTCDRNTGLTSAATPSGSIQIRGGSLQSYGTYNTGSVGTTNINQGSILTTSVIGTMTTTVTTTGSTALSQTFLDLRARVALVEVARIRVMLVHSSCSLDNPSPMSTGPQLSQFRAQQLDDDLASEDCVVRENELDEEVTSDVVEACDEAAESVDDHSDLTDDEPTPVPPPSEVKLRETFTVSTVDGTELGTASIRDIQYDPACGGTANGDHVAIQLDLATSDYVGQSRIDGFRAGDFGQLQPDGSITPFRTAVSNCADASPALPVSTEPSTKYSGWIVFDIRDTSLPFVFQPEGTAGWKLALPPKPEPEPTVELTPEVTPDATPEPAAEPTPTPGPTTEPPPAPPSTTEPPPPTTEPSPEPTVTQEPTVTVAPTTEPATVISEEPLSATVEPDDE